MRTLLLEDDGVTREIYRSCIADAGHEVLDCATIEGATNILRTSHVDLIILDLLIGNSNSLALSRYAGYAAPEAEIIVITGSGKFASGELMSQNPGISWVLRKPLPLDDLVAFVDFACARLSKRTVVHAPLGLH